jgi:Lon protease-like protein
VADEPQRVLPLFPLEQVVLFPGMSLPLRVFEERYKVMIGACQVTDQLFGVVLIRSGREVGEPAEPEQVGCTARMVRVDRIPDGQMHILTVGEQRFRLVGQARAMPEGYLVGDVQMLAESAAASVQTDLLAGVTREFKRYQQAIHGLTGQDPMNAPELPTDPVRLSYRVAATLYVDPRERQRLLEMDDVTQRLQQELALLKREMPRTIGPFSLN